jgi:hypothetical protein
MVTLYLFNSRHCDLSEIPFYPENNSVNTIRIRLQKSLSQSTWEHFKLEIRIVLTELFSG